ncbi:solute carrier family 22 member 15-like [Haliotis rufescens]|uniref:solute carrier family 22 member 15-like n=1 Tax=Haliotis rufescens TaxID=6454 RepID=UPI001EB04C38|nr:solute carrier family 22 member 15-like [Haliotis rufescens]
MHTDDIIEEVGGMSRFQLLLLFLIIGSKTVHPWGMLMMSFTGVPPDFWWCDKNASVVPNGAINYTYEQQCPSVDSNNTCTLVYSQEKNTVINQWNLVCEDSGVKPFITAVQMGGVVLGAALGGQSGDAIGRKKTYYLCILLNILFNLVAAFSVSWQMFTVLRFFIGAMVGSLLVVSFSYYMEFIGKYWRPMTGTMPFWPVGSALFAMTCWLRPNWSHLHIITAMIHVPFLLGWFIVPESMRWLAAHGRLKEAEEVVDQMARYNGTKKPANTSAILKQVAEEELRGRESNRKYTYLDLYRPWSLCWKSFIIQIIWLNVACVYYGISFGVGHLTGNLYLNMFLVAVIDIPGKLVVFFLSNIIGRRWTAFMFFALAACAAFSVVIVSSVGTADWEAITTVLALVCRLGIAAAWACHLVFASETYPTVIRNLGYGAANTAARVGSIVSPYIFIMGGDDLMPPFVIVGVSMFLCTLLSLVMRETMGVPLEDTTAKTSGKTCLSDVMFDHESVPFKKDQEDELLDEKV